MLFADWFLPGYKAGGPIRSILGLIGNLSDDVEFLIVTRDRDMGDSKPYAGVAVSDWNPLGAARVFYVAPGWRGYCALLRVLRKTKFDLMYFNSFVSPTFSIVPIIARHFGILPAVPVVIAPRGELSAGALGLKPRKKRIFIALAKALRLHKDATWHASNTLEQADIVAQFGARDTRIVVASNLSSHSLPVGLAAKRKQVGSARLVVLSRLSRKKNITFALQILSRATGTVSLDIYGPREDMEYWKECEALIERVPPNVTVSYAGTARPEDVGSLLSGYDFFFLPTLGENFGHVVLEALSAGVPVIISDRTPWRDLQAKRAGWDVPLENPDRFVEVVDECTKMGSDEYAAMSAKARLLASDYLNDQTVVEANRVLFAQLS